MDQQDLERLADQVVYEDLPRLSESEPEAAHRIGLILHHLYEEQKRLLLRMKSAAELSEAYIETLADQSAGHVQYWFDELQRQLEKRSDSGQGRDG